MHAREKDKPTKNNLNRENVATKTKNHYFEHD